VPFVTEHIYQNIVQGVSEDAREKSVHLCNFPSPDESLMDVELETSMELLSNLVEAGRRARSDAGIKIRQPLQEVVIMCSTEQREKGEELVEILKEEVNVKDVQFRDLSVDVTDALAGERADYNQVEVDEETCLFLNCCPSKTLVEEGLVRDIVRRIQGMRKDLDLEYTEKIGITYACDDEVEKAIGNFSVYIRDETLAVSMEKGTPANSADDARIYEKTWKIGKKEVYLAITPLSSAEKD
jgi:isoleucyl-tRNA synthetase